MIHRLIRGGAAWLLLCLPAATPLAVAQTAPSVCDRGCLVKLADQYLNALAARRASTLPLAPEVRYTENGQVLAVTDGLWGTANAVGKYRQVFADSRGDEVGLYASMRENGTPILMATRLKLRAGRITEIETILSRPTGAAATNGVGGLQRLER